jgi:hypothetical protein
VRSVGSIAVTFLLVLPALSQSRPTPAPKGTLLVTKTCALANVHGNGRSRKFYLPDGIQPLFGKQCDGSFGETRLVTPGEFRLFMHLIGPTEEYDVTCLGHMKWDSGWTSGSEHFQFDKTCVVPGGKHDYWFGEYSGISANDWDRTAGARPALPDVGTYIPYTWEGEKLLLQFERDYHDTAGVTIAFTVLQKMSSAGRIIDPSEIPKPYECPNGEIVLNGARKCRPEK